MKAHFDGKVFVPEEPVNLPRGQSVIIHVETAQSTAAHDATNGQDSWAILDQLAGSIEAPADWSAEHDHYLYGTPKRSTGKSE